MSKLFHLIEDSSVILRTKSGVYRQAECYRKGESVYAKHGTGFVRLVSSFGTSSPSVMWSDLDAKGVTIPRIGNPKYSDVPSYHEAMRDAA